MTDDEIDARLAGLARATDAVRPRGGFSAKVMARIGEERLSPLLSLRSPGRRFLPLGMLAAALAMVWAVSVSHQVDEALASGDDTELSW